MIMDTMLQFSLAQAVTSTGDTASTNVLDTGAAHDEGIGDGHDWMNVRCSTTATSGGSATVAAVIQTSVDNSTWTDAVIGNAIAVANLTAGAIMLQARLPIGMNRYIRVVYRVATAALTAGNFDAFLTLDTQAQKAYNSGFSVS